MNLGNLVLLGTAGALIYGFAGNAKAAELGRLLFFGAVLWITHEAASGRLGVGW